MEIPQTFPFSSLEPLLALLRQRYPSACVRRVPDHPDQAVIQLDQFTITITHQGTVEVTAPTHSHRQVERLALEIEGLLRQVRAFAHKQMDR